MAVVRLGSVFVVSTSGLHSAVLIIEKFISPKSSDNISFDGLSLVSGIFELASSIGFGCRLAYRQSST
jgi:hypothetical protein